VVVVLLVLFVSMVPTVTVTVTVRSVVYQGLNLLAMAFTAAACRSCLSGGGAQPENRSELRRPQN
jgi:hypothetical protein